MGDAGQQARRVVEELRTALQATAVQSVKTTRSLAKFDEINRLPAPAVEKAAAPEKERRTAGNAAGTARRTAKGSDGREWADGWRAVLDSLRGVWADFWVYLSSFFAPFAAAWQTVWKNSCGTKTIRSGSTTAHSRTAPTTARAPGVTRQRSTGFWPWIKRNSNETIRHLFLLRKKRRCG